MQSLDLDLRVAIGAEIGGEIVASPESGDLEEFPKVKAPKSKNRMRVMLLQSRSDSSHLSRLGHIPHLICHPYYFTAAN
jgi:hypothetical protein